MSSCPPEITDPALRASWHALSEGARASLLCMAVRAGAATAGGDGGSGAPSSYAFPTGLPPPRGRPFDEDEIHHDADGEDDAPRGRATRRAAPRRRRSGRSWYSQSQSPSVNQRRQRQTRRRLGEDGAYSPAEECQGSLQQPQIDPSLDTIAQASQLEPTSSAQHDADRPARGGRTAAYTSRGGLAAHRLPRRGQDPPEESATTEVFSPDPDAIKDDSDPLDIIKNKRSDLSPMQQKAISDIQPVIIRQFRLATGVSKKESWPQWGVPRETEFMPVNFEANVNESVNPALFNRVAELAMQELKQHSTKYVSWMNAPDVKLTHGVLCEAAKKTFRNFKKQYGAQFDEEKKKKLVENERASRRLNRRKAKSANLLTSVPAYIDRHGVDPTPFLVQDMMSDDASGPEDAVVEDVAAWKRRMAQNCGMGGKSDTQLKNTTFFERISPNWRSESLTDILHELWEIFMSTVPARVARAMAERVSGTGRASDDPPLYSPFNFGINRLWYEEFKDKHPQRTYLRDWYTYPDPPGFGDNSDAPSAT
ncbi:hypothetical protein BV20DRAFT_1124089 [Pilatotrama ljubarskyi]|nr:hypothetical protein BV20DRAFT_1124089 [Pilatotrama ljubarskyi]